MFGYGVLPWRWFTCSPSATAWKMFYRTSCKVNFHVVFHAVLFLFKCKLPYMLITWLNEAPVQKITLFLFYFTFIINFCWTNGRYILFPFLRELVLLGVQNNLWQERDPKMPMWIEECVMSGSALLLPSPLWVYCGNMSNIIFCTLKGVLIR